MDLEEKYKEETGKLATRQVNIHEAIVRSYTNEYVKWLESKALIIDSVVVPKGTFCNCETPNIRTGNNTNGYCGICGLDIN